ncbi:hypothetical protein GHK79_04715 [Enterococcus faecium]|uniref:hypothetical protein n=1 Tax=Enterococcus faecium TaxID=1352 RepID=UPI0019210610|nr:hypothetical protein [Enterococcus faecium]EHK9937510.1 hypothetical protein [Enterococcus faecium]MBL3707129.1 hypothetical protein [Enterococcus faecium]
MANRIKKVSQYKKLDNLKRAYGRTLELRDYMKNLLFPFLFGAGLTFLMLHNLLFSLGIGIFYGIYGYKILLPKNVLRFYNNEAYVQRNRFMNNLTQVLADESISWFHGLEIVAKQIEGELQEDLYRLIACLYGCSEQERIVIFQEFQEKYADDKIFCMYIDQLAIISVEGRTTVDMFRDVNSFHNQLREKKKEFVDAKMKIVRQLELCGGLIIGILILLHYFPLGIEEYEKAFASQIYGYVICSGLLLAMSVILHKACVYFFDDELMQ